MKQSANFSGMLILLTFLACQLAVGAKTLDSQQMEQALNAFDRPGLFAQPGASNPVPKKYSGQPAFPGSSQQGQFNYPPPQQQYSRAQQPQTMAPQYGYGFPSQQAVQAPVQHQAPMSPLQALFSGQSKPAAPPPKPINPLQYVMQQFLGGGGTTGSGAGNDPQKLSNAQEYLQTANDQASRAYNACQRASYGSDTYARKAASSEAYYAAQAARYAANNATSAAAGGSSAANDAAAQARDAADRAQASADQASSNANGGGGW